MEEASNGKITRKYIFRFLLIFLLIVIIGGIAILMSFSSKVDNFKGSDIIEPYKAINSMIRNLIILNVIAAIVATLLATLRIKKKYKINEENAKSIFKNITIFLAIIGILSFATHMGIKNVVFKEALEDNNYTISEVKEGLNDAEKLAKEMGIEVEEIKYLKSFMKLSDWYSHSDIIFLLMIGLEYVLIMKRKKTE